MKILVRKITTWHCWQIYQRYRFYIFKLDMPLKQKQLYFLLTYNKIACSLFRNYIWTNKHMRHRCWGPYSTNKTPAAKCCLLKPSADHTLKTANSNTFCIWTWWKVAVRKKWMCCSHANFLLHQITLPLVSSSCPPAVGDWEELFKNAYITYRVQVRIVFLQNELNEPNVGII